MVFSTGGLYERRLLLGGRRTRQNYHHERQLRRMLKRAALRPDVYVRLRLSEYGLVVKTNASVTR